jgi:GNAT superfamily N-acetyltransferase
MIKPLNRNLTQAQPVIDAYWASFIGCEPAHLHTAARQAIRVNPDIDGLIAFRALHASATVAVSLDNLRVTGRAVQDIFDDLTEGHTALAREDLIHDTCASGGLFDVYGPGVIHYLEGDLPTRSFPEMPERLGIRDELLLETFLSRLNMKREYTLTDSSTFPYAVGIFEDEQLIAYGTVRVWDDTLGEVFLDVLPKHRGRGLGMNLALHLTGWILEHTPWIPQYDTEATNAHSLALARSCGYVPYAEAIFAS